MKLWQFIKPLTGLNDKYGKSDIPEKQLKAFDDFIEKEIPNVNFFEPDGKPKKYWKMFYGKTWDEAREAALNAEHGTESGAARHAALVAVRHAAHDAAWNIDRVSAWLAAWNAAFDAAWNAVGYPAQDTTSSREQEMARSAAWGKVRNLLMDVAWDAELYSEFIILSALDFKDKAKHRKHIEARWEVWKKGYGLLCDVDGVLYVYCVRRINSQISS